MEVMFRREVDNGGAGRQSSKKCRKKEKASGKGGNFGELPTASNTKIGSSSMGLTEKR